MSQSQACSDLAARLTSLHDSLKQTVQLIHGLANLQPHSSDSADSNTDETQADLAAEIRESLKQQDEEIELLQLDIDDVAPAPSRRSGRKEGDKEREGRGLLERCRRLREELTLARNHFRKAQLQAKRNFDLAKEHERIAYLSNLRAAANAIPDPSTPTDAAPPPSEASMRTSLFARRGPPSRAGTPSATKEDLLLTTTSDVTSSLRRTRALMISELSRSQFATDTLNASNAALEELSQHYGTLDDLLAKSRGLLGTLLTSQKSDTWYLQTAIYILSATIAWLLFRRLLYGPLWWLVWLPVKLTTKGAWGAGGALLSVARMKGTGAAVEGSNVSSTMLLPSGTVVQMQASAAPPHVSDESLQERRDDHDSGTNDDAKYNMSDMVAKLAEASRAIVGGTATAPSTGSYTEATAAAGDEDVPTKDDNAEQAEAAAQPAQARRQQQQREVRRADGQVLRERDEATEPRNPKKRMFEEPPPQPGRQQQREL